MSAPALGAGKGFSKRCREPPDSGRDKSGFSESAQLGIMSELDCGTLQWGPGALGSSPSVMAASGTRHSDALVARTLFLHISSSLAQVPTWVPTGGVQVTGLCSTCKRSGGGKSPTSVVKMRWLLREEILPNTGSVFRCAG